MDSQNSNKDYKRPFLSRKFKWVLSILFFTTVFGILFIYIFLDHIVKNRIIHSVHESSEGMYNLNIGDLNAKFWSGAITMKEVWLKPDMSQLKVLRAKDTAAYIPNVNLYFDSVNISSIEWFRYLLNSEKLEVGRVLIDKPDFIIHSRPSPSQNIKEASRNFLDLLPGIIAAFTGSLNIEEILVQNGSLHNDIYFKEGITHQLADSIYIDLKKIVIDTISPKKTLYSESTSIEFRNYSLNTEDNLTFLFISHVKGTVEDSVLKMNEIYFSKRDSIYKEIPNEIKISMNAINTKGVDYGKLLKDQKIFFRTMVLISPDVQLQSSENPVHKYSKKNENDKVESILEQVIPYLASTFKIDTLTVKDGSVRYNIENNKQKIIQSAENIHLDFSRVLVDSMHSESMIYVEDMRIDLKNYILQKDNTSQLNIASFKASVSDSTLKLQGLDFKSKDKNNEEYFLKVKEIDGKGMDFMMMFKEKKVWINSLIIRSPIVKTSMESQSNNKIKKSGGTLFKDILGPFTDASLKTKKLVVVDANINHVIKSDSGLVEQNAQNVSLTFNNLLIDSSTAENSNFFESFYLGIKNYELKVHQENFSINIKNINSSSESSFIEMNDISLNQINSFGEFQKYYFINTIKSAYARNIDFDRLIKKKEVHIGFLDLNGMRLEIFLDGGKPVRPDYANRMPQEFMQKVKFYLRIDTCNLNDSYIAYSDQKPNEAPVKFTFEKTNIKITNLSNDQELMSDSTPAHLNGETLMMGKGLLEFYIAVPLLSPNFDAHYGGVMYEMDGDIFKDFVALAGITIESGRILPSNFDIDIKNGSAIGTLKFVYEDLHIKVLNEEGKESTIKTLLGNLTVKNNNPNDEGEKPEVVQVCAKRSMDDSFFFFLWRVLKGGITQTITKSTIYSVSNE